MEIKMKTTVLLLLVLSLVPAAFCTDTNNSLSSFPSAKQPWKRAGHEEQFAAYRQEIRKLTELPPDQVCANPAAADFPGTVPAEAPRVERTVVVDTRVPRWHSTGLYAAPGEIITATVSTNAAQAKLRLRIGCHKDLLWSEKIPAWKRVPEITRSFAITETVTRAANAFGGPVYIEVPPDCEFGEVTVKIQNAVAAPLFELGKTDLDSWKQQLRNNPAPWAELVGSKLAISLPSENVRQLDNPDEVLKFWDRVVAAEDELAGQTNRTSPERFVLDRQISAGYMHSGYPIMAWLDQANKVADLESLKKGNWGFFHELGHNHQRSDWVLAGTTEITVNIFSMYCFENICGLPRHGHNAMSDASREKNLRAYFSDSTASWTGKPFTGLIFYDQLVEGFGWDAFHKIFIEYRNLPKSERPKNDDEKRDQWLVRFSKTVGKNLGPFFEAWRIPTSEAARNSITNLPAWLPEPDFPKRFLAAK
jgi:hypothetical protein